jgi:preprotein translocase subunit SecA
MRIFAGERIQTLMDRLGMEEGVPIEHNWVTKAVENAQKKVEERNFDIRKHLLEYDDVMNQQRKSVYTLRRQILEGQYRTVPTEEEQKKGATPQPVVSEVDRKLAGGPAVAEQMIKHHARRCRAAGSPPEELARLRDEARKKSIAELVTVRPAALERDVYQWFGTRVPGLEKLGNDAKEALELVMETVAMSLTEQRERLLDLVDDLISTMIETYAPPNKHYEDWDLGGLAKTYEQQFGIKATGIEKATESEELAQKLYADAEKVLRKKEEEITPERYLRLFRNFYLQEIDRQWIDHLSGMEHLRDGIGLRGYGQRDPKKEYKKGATTSSCR